MPVNRNALVRYKTIDICLQNRFRKSTLEALVEACSEALYEYEGIRKGVSRRSVQADIQMMRSDKLGYNAPIVVVDKKYYTYEDKNYSITNTPVSVADLEKLTESVEILKQFQNFSHFKDLGGLVQKLEDHVYAKKHHQEPVIDFEKNDGLKGIDFLDVLYRAIIDKQSVYIDYQSFKARKSQKILFHPWLLKEFRNRWFLIGVKSKGSPLLNLALDRMHAIEASNMEYVANTDIDLQAYFKDVIGVTVAPSLVAQEVRLYVSHKHAPYLITKPLHHSQKIIERDDYGVLLSLTVQHNFELEKEILSLGEEVMVVSPESLKRSIMERLRNASEQYEAVNFMDKLSGLNVKLEQNGFYSLIRLYTNKSVRNMNYHIAQSIKKNSPIETDTEFLSILRNKGYNGIINTLGDTLSTQISLITEKDQYLKEWAQDTSQPQEHWLLIFLSDRSQAGGHIQLVSGSHHKTMSPDEISLITGSVSPAQVKIEVGGAILLDPGIIHRISPMASKYTFLRIVLTMSSC